MVFSPPTPLLSLRLLLFRELRGVESEIHRVPRAPAGGGLLGHLRGAGDGVGLSQGRSTKYMGIVSKWLLSLSNFLVYVFALTRKWLIYRAKRKCRPTNGSWFQHVPRLESGIAYRLSIARVLKQFSLGMILHGKMIRPLEFPILL